MWHGSSSLRTSVSTLVTITLAPANSTRSQSELKALTFQGDPDARKLLDAIEHFKEKQGAIDKTAPVTFLDPTEVAAVNKDSKFRVSLYKALLFLHVQSAIKSGGLNLEQSYKYRPLDDYLIDRARWQRDKQQLIERAGLEAFVDPHKVLDKLDEALHRQYLISNGNIIEGKNPFIKFGKNGGFTLATPKQEESEAEPLQHFFPERSYVPLLEILSTVNRYTHYVDELQHWQQRYHHRRPSESTIFAGVIGIGCMIGLRKMMRISHPINEAELEHTVNWHFSVTASRRPTIASCNSLAAWNCPTSRVGPPIVCIPRATARNSRCASIP